MECNLLLCLLWSLFGAHSLDRESKKPAAIIREQMSNTPQPSLSQVVTIINVWLDLSKWKPRANLVCQGSEQSTCDPPASFWRSQTPCSVWSGNKGIWSQTIYQRCNPLLWIPTQLCSQQLRLSSHSQLKILVHISVPCFECCIQCIHVNAAASIFSTLQFV